MDEFSYINVRELHELNNSRSSTLQPNHLLIDVLTASKKNKSNCYRKKTILLHDVNNLQTSRRIKLYRSKNGITSMIQQEGQDIWNFL